MKTIIKITVNSLDIFKREQEQFKSILNIKKLKNKISNNTTILS